MDGDPPQPKSAGFPAADGGALTTAAPSRLRPATVVRDRIIARLSEAFANDVIDVDEFERRVTVAQRSENVDEIQTQVTDLPAPAAASETSPTVPPRTAMVPSHAVKPSGMVVTIMGGVERKGSWTVPRSLNVGVLMGGAQIDLREALLPPGRVEIRVAALMGGVEIIVPPNLPVEADGVAIMGGFAHVDRAPADPDPAAPMLRVTGLALMGGVHIEMRLPGESPREARKRRRRERRELQRAR